MTNRTAHPSPPAAATRSLQVAALVPGGLGLCLALGLFVDTNACEGELCGLGYLVAAAVAVPSGLAVLAGVLSVLLRRRPGAAFGVALAGALCVVVPVLTAWVLFG